MFVRTILLTTLLLAPLASAQTAVEAPRVDDEVSVGYVMIPFTVLGNQGTPITDLRASEVSLLVDGAPVRSDMFEQSLSAPVSFTILIDASGSMALGDKMDTARAAVATLLARRLSGDDFSLWVFADDQAREVVPVTKDPMKIHRALSDLKPYGKTAFFDALAEMPERTQLGANASRAVILLSDGIDNASKLTRPQLAKLLEGVSVPIYALGLREPAEARTNASQEELSDIALLREVAELTGGRMYLGSRPKQLAAAVEDLARVLRAQYLIGFSPTGKGAVKYRQISLRLGNRVQSVRVRAGYRGTEPPVVARTKNRSIERSGSK
jgi:Ca-activated chloride channel family protein